MKILQTMQTVATWTALLVPSAVILAQPTKKAHPVYPRPAHHNTESALNVKKMPKSTPNVALPNGKAGAQALEVSRLEQQSVAQIQAETRTESRSARNASAPRLGDARDHAHSVPINFSYHTPQAGATARSSLRR